MKIVFISLLALFTISAQAKLTLSDFIGFYQPVSIQYKSGNKQFLGPKQIALKELEVRLLGINNLHFIVADHADAKLIGTDWDMLKPIQNIGEDAVVDRWGLWPFYGENDKKIAKLKRNKLIQRDRDVDFFLAGAIDKNKYKMKLKFDRNGNLIIKRKSKYFREKDVVLMIFKKIQ